YNKRTKTVEESIHVKFDETSNILKKTDDEVEDLSKQLKDAETSPTPEDKDDHTQTNEVNEKDMTRQEDMKTFITNNKASKIKIDEQIKLEQ
ncbi:hypothetical protein ACLOJK_019336, partial [Asimina triloba]